MTNNTGSILPKWLDGNSGFESVRLAVCDLNGILRGKRFPLKSINKLLKNGSRLPLSTSCIDIWGADLINSPFLFETGDGDGIVKPTGANLIPITWLDHPSVLLPSWMSDEKNNPSPVDPRHILNDVLYKYAALGLNPVLAFELEFYLLDPGSNKLLVSKNPKTKTRLKNTSALSIDELDSFENFFVKIIVFHQILLFQKMVLDNLKSTCTIT